MKIEFESVIVRERSITPQVENLGKAQCTMELFINEDKQSGFIEWIVDFPDGSGEDVGIGVWFEDKTLTDYDGVFSLPVQAIELLRKAGYIVPEEFED